MEKTPVTNIASVGIVYRASDPRQIFAEIKDDGYPIKLGRRKLCFIGGNWIGEPAKNDLGPIDTFRREFDEEISFDRPVRNSKEYVLLSIAGQESFAPTNVKIAPTSSDIEALHSFKQAVSAICAPFAICCNAVSKKALDEADPENKRDGFTSLVWYWKAAINERLWATLKELQEKFGNLSNESITVITSSDEVAKNGLKGLFGHDQVLRRFLAVEGYKTESSKIPIQEGIESTLMQPMQPIQSTYENILKFYDVAKKPQ